MYLTQNEERMLNSEEGYAVKKSMEILVALGNIYGAEKLIEVGSVQVAGVSYHNLGEAGLEYLNELAKDGKVKVLTTLNPAGMDLRTPDWPPTMLSSPTSMCPITPTWPARVTPAPILLLPEMPTWATSTVSSPTTTL